MENGIEKCIKSKIAIQITNVRKQFQFPSIVWPHYYKLNQELSTENKGILITVVPYRHRGGRIQTINAWYLNTHMVYL